MRTASPLRYPGGKSAMSDLLISIRRLNRLGNTSIAEPFAGGAGASLRLLFLEATPRIHINDLDRAIHDFWWSIIKRPNPFLEKLGRTQVSMTEWRRQKEIHRHGASTSRLQRGFAAFYLNRCNRSGIILNGGPIGGTKQQGVWKLGARFNKPALRDRIDRVVEYRERIHVSCMDGIDFLRSLDIDETFFFIDPPYYEKGPLLYLNSIDPNYHEQLASELHSKRDAAWVLTYDDCNPIRRLYTPWARIRPFRLKYAASKNRVGNEIMITPKWMHLPKRQDSKAVLW